jgi:hypothetical protein
MMTEQVDMKQLLKKRDKLLNKKMPWGRLGDGTGAQLIAYIERSEAVVKAEKQLIQMQQLLLDLVDPEPADELVSSKVAKLILYDRQKGPVAERAMQSIRYYKSELVKAKRAMKQDPRLQPL